MNRVLVAYASKYGATAEIAERIGAVLRQAGLAVDVLPADRAGDPASYQAVVLGSALYVGRWRKEAARFLETNAAALAERPLWLFSSGPTGEGSLETLMQGWRAPAGLEAVFERVKPRDHAIFHGAMDAARMSTLERWLIKKIKAPLGDFRDWEAIPAWAAGIAQAIAE